MNRVKVLYVEDDVEWRNGLTDFFKDHEQINLIDSVATMEECFAILQSTSIDIVVLDIILSNTTYTGLDIALDIHVQYPQSKIIMLSSLQDDDSIFYEAFMNGAYDYLYKEDFEILPETIFNAINNKKSKYGDRLKKLVYEQKKRLLSPGDERILSMVRIGKTQTQIADELNISLSAVKKQINRVIKKFNWNGSSLALAEKCYKWEIIE